MRNAKPQIGRFFTENELRAREKARALTVVKQIFGEHDPVGKQIKINKINFTVIGVLPQRGASFFRDQDDLVMIPVTTAMYRVLGKTYL